MIYLSSLEVFNTKIHIGTYDDILQIISEVIEKQKKVSIDTSNTMVVTLAVIDKNFRNALKSFDILMPDGMPLVWYIRLLGGKIKDTCTGPETALRVWNKYSKTKRIMIVGSDKETQALFEARHGKPVKWLTNNIDPDNSKTIKWLLEEIHKADPDIIFLGLGCPKSYYLLQKVNSGIKRGAVIHVGGSFDIISGRKKMTPVKIQKLGLGWLFRSFQEPRRLVPRYLKFNSLFILFAFLYFFRNKKSNEYTTKER